MALYMGSVELALLRAPTTTPTKSMRTSLTFSRSSVVSCDGRASATKVESNFVTGGCVVFPLISPFVPPLECPLVLTIILVGVAKSADMQSYE
jgi:hypothetical protein